MAFFKAGGAVFSSDSATAQTFYDAAGNLAYSITQAQRYAANGDSHGLVAAVGANGAKVWPGNEFTGGSWRYFPLLHTASSAWAGLTLRFVYFGDIYANPYADYSKNTNLPVYVGNGISDSEVMTVENNNSTTVITIIFSVISLLISSLLIISNIMLFKKYIQLQQPQMIELVDNLSPQTTSPGAVNSPVNLSTSYIGSDYALSPITSEDRELLE